MSWIKRRTPLKYGNKKSRDYSGRSFDSQLERSVFAMLELLQKAGEILSIQQQDTIRLTRANILYKPDFRVESTGGEIYWVEAKGFETPEWKLKKRLWKCYGPGVLKIYTGSAARPILSETLIPTNNQGESNGSSEDAKSN